MDKTALICDDENRRDEVRERGFNGLDYLEVSDDHRKLTVFFLGKAPEGLQKENVRLTGGRRVRDVRVTGIEINRYDDPEFDDQLIVKVNKPGDFSTYTLCLVDLDEEGHPTNEPFPGFDPRYYCLDFSFMQGCPSDLDCKIEPVCPPEPLDEPEISYLAKDYASFRQLLLDRLSVIMPDWKERHVPNIGIALVELLAYTGDHLSYYQDAVATEAYLDTARQRISVRRHARLVDYRMHEGCNARAWVCVRTDMDIDLDPQQISFVTGRNDVLPVGECLLTWDDLRDLRGQYEVFEPLRMSEYRLRWGDIKDLTGLAEKLSKPKDPLSRYLKGQFSPRLLRSFDEYNINAEAQADNLRQALLDELNDVLSGPSLYAEQRFKHINLTGKIEQLLERNPRGEALLRLNRLLLEVGYEGELVKSEKIHLYKDHKKIYFYTWGDNECCLPKGATRATLKGQWAYIPRPEPEPPEPDKTPVELQQQEPPKDSTGATRKSATSGPILHLQIGDILILEEVKGPRTGEHADADPAHRHAVRLTRVTPDVDPLNDQPVLEIEWAEADALPFPLCISTSSDAPECKPLQDVSVACGNVILVDHGQRVDDEDLGCVPEDRTEEDCPDPCRPPEIRILPGRYRPQLKGTSLTFSQPLRREAPATAVMMQDPRLALPWVRLTSAPDPDCKPSEIEKMPPSSGLPDEDPNQTPEQEKQGPIQEPQMNSPMTEDKTISQVEWFPQIDLLASQASDRHFVVEMDDDRRAHLRFGDGELGRHPQANAKFKATYRVGNGPVGNVGAEAITHIVTHNLLSGVDLQLCNPLPAVGGTTPEPVEEVKLFAPHAFRHRLERAITAADYAQIVMRDFEDKVQRAAASLRWTGSWYEVLVAIDPKGSERADPALLDEIAGHLYRYRRIGHDLVVESARYVPLDIALIVCVLPDYLRGHVKAALLKRLSNRALPDGGLGFFHPDNLTFGEGVYLSKLVAAAQAVPGVESVTVAKLERLFEGENGEIASGVLPLGPLKVARLDNDPGFPENGRLTLDMRGGR